MNADRLEEIRKEMIDARSVSGSTHPQAPWISKLGYAGMELLQVLAAAHAEIERLTSENAHLSKRCIEAIEVSLRAIERFPVLPNREAVLMMAEAIRDEFLGTPEFVWKRAEKAAYNGLRVIGRASGDKARTARDEPADDLALFFADVRLELMRAIAKWPNEDVLHRIAALVGEVGELAEGVLKGDTPLQTRTEAVQIVVTAWRAYRAVAARVELVCRLCGRKSSAAVPENSRLCEVCAANST